MLRIAGCRNGLREQHQSIRPHEFCTRCAIIGKALFDFRNAFSRIAELADSPAPQHLAPRTPIWKAILAPDINGSFGSFEGLGWFASRLPNRSLEGQRKPKTVGMIELNGSINCLRAVGHGAIGQAHKPLGPREISLGQNGRIRTILKTVMMVPIRII